MSPHTYSARGFLQVLAFSAVLCGTTGLVAFLSAPETLSCQRSDGRVSCRLDRRALGVPIAVRELGRVQDVKLVTHAPEAARVGQRPRQHGPVFSLTYYAEGIAADGVQTPDALAQEEVARGLRAFLADPGASRYQATLAGRPTAHRWSLGGFLFGASLVVLWALGYAFPALRPRPR